MRFAARSNCGVQIIPWSPGVALDPVIARLSAVRRRTIIRITGGCANMSDDDAHGVLELFSEAFQGFDGALLIGGTRMVRSNNTADVLFGITEVGPAIRRANPECFMLGIVPRCCGLLHSTQQSVLVVKQITEADSAACGEEHRQFLTIVHPDQDMVVLATTHITMDAIWDDEVEFCWYMTQTLVEYGHWQSLLVAYNGGGVTEREVRATAQRRWPVLLVRGSGRVSDKLAEDTNFLEQNPSVIVCDRTVQSMRTALERLGVVAS